MNQTNMHEPDREVPTHCPECGKPLPPDAPHGICPVCLLNVDLSDDFAVGRGSSQSGKNHSADGNASFNPPAADELKGSFPNLDILEVIGFGGMGAVYRARQKNLDRFVALKIIRPEAVDYSGFAERFAREARALARLNHQNIVGIHDFGEVDNKFYLVMEFVDGVTLRQLIVENRLASSQALPVVQQICEALQFAHDEGVVHRDIKPENILIDTRGRVKIADFGLAKLLSDSEHNQTLTGTHQVMGTPRYMAPEQMEGARQVDHRADIYSLGVVFYEMLTGELPLGQFEPPSRKANLDQRLDQVVMRTLAKEPERRYQRASDVKTDVDSICQSQSDPATLASPAESPLDPFPSPVDRNVASDRRQTSYRETKSHSVPESDKRKTALTRQSIVFSTMTVLCFLTAASMFFWWGQIHLEGMPVQGNGLVQPDSSMKSTVIFVPAYRYSHPFFASILGLVAGFFCLATLRTRSMYAVILSSSAGIALATSAFVVLIATPLTEHDAQFRGFARGLNYTLGSSAIEAFTELHNLDRITITKTPTFTCFAALFIGIGLIATSVLAGQSKLEEFAESETTSSDALLEFASKALSLAGWATILTLILLFALMLFGNIVLDHEQFSHLTTYVLVPTILPQLAIIFLFTPLILISAIRLRRGFSPRLAWFCAIVVMLPMSPTFLFGLPLGAIVLWTLSQSRVKRQMEGRTVDPTLGKNQIQSAGQALWISGILEIGIFLALVTGAVISFGTFTSPTGQILPIHFDSNVRQVPMAFQNFHDMAEGNSQTGRNSVSTLVVAIIMLGCLPVFAHALAMTVGGKALMRLRPTRWRLAAAAALFPLTPVWFVSMPVGVYTLAIFRQTVDSKTGSMEDLLDGSLIQY